MLEELPELTGFEILELGDGGSMELAPYDYKLGKTTIVTNEYPAGKLIRVLRLWIEKDKKPLGPNYWDITAQTLIAQWLPYLKDAAYRGKTYKITKYGVKPRARFTLETPLKKG